MQVADLPNTGAVPSETHARDDRYAWFVTAALLLGYTFAFIDRQVLNLLVEPIRAAFALDDTRVSLLIGVAFVIPFALFAPIGGRLADTWHRRNLCVLVIGLWSLFTIGCGLADSFWLLFLARVGVGAAEACLMPSAWSLIADYFSRERLPRAMSLFLLGPYLGGGLALMLGGTVINALAVDAPAIAGALAPWRVTFIVAGLVGLVPLLTILLVVREPARAQDGASAAPGAAPPLREVAAFFLRERRFYGGFYGGISLQTITFYAFPAWIPTLLVRKFDVSLGAIGLQYGAVMLLAGCFGVLCAPLMGRWLAARGFQDYNLRIGMIACILLVPLCALLPFLQSYGAALAVCALVTFTCSVPMPMAGSALQTVTPNRMRGVATSLYMLVVSLIGVAIPPTLIALLTDHVFHDPAALGASLAIVCCVSAAAAAFVLWRALAAYRSALARL